MKRIYVVGTADTKGEELAFLADAIAATGADVWRVDVGIRDAAVPVDIAAKEIAGHHPHGRAAVLGGDERGAAVAAMHIQPILRNVNANSGFHRTPSLPNRASLAAQATVRVRWNGGRRPLLSHGLQGPKMLRSLVRHRTCCNSRIGKRQVTKMAAAR